MTAPGVRRDIGPRDVAGPQIALEEPGLAWGLGGRCRGRGSGGPGGEPQKRACGIDVYADHTEEVTVGDEIGGGPVLGKSDDLPLREAADEPTARNGIVGESLGEEIGVRERERERAANNWDPVALQASAHNAGLGGGLEPRKGGIGIKVPCRTEIREATEPTKGGGGLAYERIPACDGVDHAGVVGRPRSDLPGAVEVVAVAARRQRLAGTLGKAPGAAGRGGLRGEERRRQEQGPQTDVERDHPAHVSRGETRAPRASP